MDDQNNLDGVDTTLVMNQMQAAAFLHIPLTTVAFYTKKGIIPGHRLGTRTKYNRLELQDLVSLKKHDEQKPDPVLTYLEGLIEKRKKELLEESYGEHSEYD